jgi:hypothetical protein
MGLLNKPKTKGGKTVCAGAVQKGQPLDFILE